MIERNRNTMIMNTLDYLKILKNEIHTVVCATSDDNGMPYTSVMDIMLADEQGLYFITAKGKGVYKRLISQSFIALSGFYGGDGSLNKKAVSIRGAVLEAGDGLLADVFRENPYMGDIYPNEESRKALTVFQLYEGAGEYFDLSAKPITRDTFMLSSKQAGTAGYYITPKCSGCKRCLPGCPTNCIMEGNPYKIEQRNCLHCGICKEICPENAVIYRGYR